MRRHAVMAVVLAGLFFGPMVPIAAANDEWEETRKETFRAVWSIVNESYFDPSFGGIDWRKIGERYRDLLPTANDNAALRGLLQAMLQELNRSHFALIPREAVVLNPAERGRIGVMGIDLGVIGGSVVVMRVRPGSPAEQAGIGSGWSVTAIGDLAFSRVAESLREAGIAPERASRYLADLGASVLAAPVGARLTLALVSPAGEPREFELVAVEHAGDWSAPIGNFPSQPLVCDAARGDDGIATLRFSAFASSLMRALRKFLRGLGGARGLVLDLRGNPGGLTDMAAGLAGLLIEHEMVLGEIKVRQGAMRIAAYPQENAFLGPVAILIDRATASTGEVLAAGLRDHGRARLFGERTAGAALPSAFRRLKNGDLLQHAIGDFRTPKQATIEGSGVAPDVAVGPTPADLAAGRDPVLAAAKAWISGAGNSGVDDGRRREGENRR